MLLGERPCFWLRAWRTFTLKAMKNFSSMRVRIGAKLLQDWTWGHALRRKQAFILV